jgi:hypothetical protein
MDHIGYQASLCLMLDYPPMFLAKCESDATRQERWLRVPERHRTAIEKAVEIVRCTVNRAREIKVERRLLREHQRRTGRFPFANKQGGGRKRGRSHA